MSTMTPTASHDTQTLADGGTTAAALDPQIAELQTGGISLSETLEIALKSLTANTLRTLLTALGIIIGVTVVGVLAAKGGSGFGSTDDGVIVPLSTAQRRLFGGRAIKGGAALVSSIAVQAKDADRVTNALNEITQTLRDRHNLPASGDSDDFSVINQQDILNSVVQTTQTLMLFLGAIAAISLLVGGIGIMNIMLVPVHERTREIGLRKAIGARESDILIQFLLEALIISLLGALIGLTLGVLIALGVDLSGLITTAPSLDAAALGRLRDGSRAVLRHRAKRGAPQGAAAQWRHGHQPCSTVPA